MTGPLGWRRAAATAAAVALLAGLAGCGGNLAADGSEEVSADAGPLRENRGRVAEGKLFGEDLSVNAIRDGTFLPDTAEGDRLPVNRYLWQASLDTLSFLPLDSTDPFTGVIATEWSAAPDAPGERFKVTVYLTRPALEASSLKVAVFREARNADGLWVPQPVAAETAAQLETAILTRARQIRIAALEAESAG